MQKDLDLVARVAQEAGTTPPKDLSPLEKWASFFTWAVFVAVVLGSLGLYIRFCNAPMPPIPDTNGKSADEVSKAMSQYKELRELNARDLTSQFDLLVGKSLLPILGTLVGYMLGKKTSDGGGR